MTGDEAAGRGVAGAKPFPSSGTPKSSGPLSPN